MVGNHFQAEGSDGTTSEAGAALNLQLNAGSAPEHVLIQGNVLIGTTGVNITGGSNYLISGNVMRRHDEVLNSTGGAGVSVSTVNTAALEGINVFGNTMDEFQYGVQVTALGYDITRVRIQGNEVLSASYDVRLKDNNGGETSAYVDTVGAVLRQGGASYTRPVTETVQ